MIKRRLILLTSHFPYGFGEPFLKYEIDCLINKVENNFNEILIISTNKLSSKGDITTQIPLNAKAYKIGRSYKKIKCGIYALIKLFSVEAISELMVLSKLEYKPGLKEIIKQFITFFAYYKRIDIFLKKFLNDEEYTNLIYSYWLSAGAYTGAKLNNKYKNAKTIARCHGGEVRDYETYIPFRKIVDNKIDGIFHIAEDRMNEYKRIINPIRDENNEAPQYISRLGVSIPDKCEFPPDGRSDTLYIVSVSNIIRIKRIDLLINAISKIDNSIRVEWVHFGDGSLFEEMKKQSDEKLSRLSNVIYKWMGKVYNDYIHKFYNNNPVDIFVNCSDNEGVPVSIMEALSHGIPSIARDVGGNREIVIDNISGRLLKKEITPYDLTTALTEIFKKKQNRDKYNLLRKSSFNFCSNNYNATVNFSDFYSNLINILENKRILN